MRSVAAGYLHVLYGNLCRLFKIERESLALGRCCSIGEQLAPALRLRVITYCYRLSLSRGLGAARGSQPSVFGDCRRSLNCQPESLSLTTIP